MDDADVHQVGKAAKATVERLVKESANDDGTVELDSFRARLAQLIEQVRIAADRGDLAAAARLAGFNDIIVGYPPG